MNPKLNLRSFNLNTLPVLREILLHGSVSKAAIALNVSQPALSAALKQLRYQFNDELIVRSGGSMKLTLRAKALLEPLEQALAAVHNLINPSTGSQSSLRSVFRIATNDHIMNTLGAPLVSLLIQEKINLLPHFLSAGGHSAEQLLSGNIECIIMPRLSLVGSHVNSDDQALLNSELLFSEELVGIANISDQSLSQSMTVEEYLARAHVSLDLDTERNISVEQAFLAGNSLKQNDIARFSCYTALCGVVASTNCIALVPASHARLFKKTFDLQTFSPPIAFPPLEWTMIWHRRNDNDDKFSQCRKIIKACVQHLIYAF